MGERKHDGRGHPRAQARVGLIDDHVDRKDAGAIADRFGGDGGDPLDLAVEHHVSQRVDADAGDIGHFQAGDVDFVDVGADHQGTEVGHLAKERAAVGGGGAGDELALGEVAEQERAVVGSADDGFGELVAQVRGAGIVDGRVVFREGQRGAGFLKVFRGDQLACFQIFLPLKFTFGARHLQFRGFDIAVGFLELREDILLVQSQDFLVTLDGFAVDHGDFHDAAADFCAQFGGEHGAEATDGHYFLGDIGDPDGCGGDLGLPLGAEQSRADLLPQRPPAPAGSAENRRCDHEPENKFNWLGFLWGGSHGIVETSEKFLGNTLREELCGIFD